MHLIKAAAIAAILAPTMAYAQDVASVCYARGSEAEGMTGITHYADGRAVRVDSPWANDSRTRVVEWQDAAFAASFAEAITAALPDIPTDLLAQCDEGWRDTIVVTYADGSTDIREGSCIRNPVAQTLDAIFAGSASLVENETETLTEGPIEGVYAPCSVEW